jgi:hypothetical protein
MTNLPIVVVLTVQIVTNLVVKSETDPWRRTPIITNLVQRTTIGTVDCDPQRCTTNTIGAIDRPLKVDAGQPELR